MQKKYLIIFFGVIVLMIPVMLFTIFAQSSSQKTTLQNTAYVPSGTVSQYDTGQRGSSPQGQAVPTVLPTATEGVFSPEVVTQKFYMEHLSSDTNPLSNGRYKNDVYISGPFKEVISDLYDNGNTTVFCMKNRTKDFVVGKLQSVYNKTNGYLSQVIISQNVPNGKDLYRVMLMQENNKWLVFDVNCVY